MSHYKIGICFLVVAGCSMALSGCSSNEKGISTAISKHLDQSVCSSFSEPQLNYGSGDLPKKVSTVKYERTVAMYNGNAKLDRVGFQQMNYLVKSGLFTVEKTKYKLKSYGDYYPYQTIEKMVNFVIYKPTKYGLDYLNSGDRFFGDGVIINHKKLVNIKHYTTPRVNQFSGYKMSNVAYIWNCTKPPAWATTATFKKLFRVDTSGYDQRYISQVTIQKKALGWTW